MPGFIKKTAVYLGLSEGEDPYAYEDEDYESAEPAEARAEAVEEEREEEFVPRFAQQPPREVGNAKGEDEGIHHAAGGQA